ncbi:MAG: HAMP domain-containing sensor histidine kinase [Bacteroidota bacterium]|nr:HAMP domain-containing sensor histidine kinase [Bacteroidota bacterium]
MNRHVFFWNIMVRIGLIIATIFLFIWLTETLLVEFLFTLAAGSLLIILQVVLLTRYVLGITRIIEQFIDAIGKEEAPEIQFGTGKALFQKLKERTNSIKQSMNARRLEKEKDERILIHVINSADMGLFCINSRGEVLFVNDWARELISHQELLHMDEIRHYNKKLWETFRDLMPGSPRVLRLDQQLISVRLKEVKIFDENYRLFSFQNIQEELHKNESDSWQKIIRVLTHEIMNAVAPMLSLSKSLQRKIKSDKSKEAKKVLDGLRMIENTGKGLIEFIEEYRRLSLLPPPKREILSLKDAFGGIMLLFDDEAREKGIQISIELEDPEIEISADVHQFEMILLNLLRNSFDSFSEVRKDKHVRIRAQRRERTVLVKVEDDGSGIAEELLDQVFVPFFSTKENGSGIGLSLVRQIMNNHEGFIQLESVPGEGTVITLIFN